MDQSFQVDVTWKRMIESPDGRQERLEERHIELNATATTNEPIDGATMATFLLALEMAMNSQGAIRAHLSVRDGSLPV